MFKDFCQVLLYILVCVTVFAHSDIDPKLRMVRKRCCYFDVITSKSARPAKAGLGPCAVDDTKVYKERLGLSV